MQKFGRFITDKALPYSEGTERAVLGGILADVPGTEEALQRLQSSYFFLPQHASLFRTLKEQVQRGQRPDLVAAVDALSADGQLASVPGGAGYISGLCDGIPRVCPLPQWVEILEQKARLREHAQSAQRILELVLSANGNSPDTLKEIETLAAQFKETVGREKELPFRTGLELAASTSATTEWIAPGLVACGGITDFFGKIKVGKSTLALAIARAAIAGVPFLSQPTKKTPVLYLSEQPNTSLREALQRADLLGQADFHVLSYFDARAIPWDALVRLCIAKCKSARAKLFVIDSLGPFIRLSGDTENNAGDALTAMQPLLCAASENLGVLVVRHARKADGELSDSARGSSAFSGAADILLSLRRVEGRAGKTVRRLEAVSRFSESVPDSVIELRDGVYRLLGTSTQVALAQAKDSIMALAPETREQGVSLDALAKQSGLARTTVQRAVEALLQAGMLRQSGAGRRGSPTVYFLAAE